MCGIAGIIGRLDNHQPRRAGADERRDGPPRPGRKRDVGLRAGLSRLGRAARPSPSLYPRPLTCWRPAHGGPGDRARRSSSTARSTISATFGGAWWPRGRSFAPPATRPSCFGPLACTGQERWAGSAVCSLSPAGTPRSAGSCWPGIPWESSLSTWRGRRIRMRAGRWPSPRSFVPCWPPGCWARLASTRRPWPAAYGMASWSALATAVKGVDLLWPGRLLEFDGAGKEVRQQDFWRIPDRAPDPITDEHSLAAILEEGLRLHLASDVPLAVLLSGGVDSSVTANLAQRAAQSPIHTFTLAFEEDELNEGPIARQIAAAIGTQHHEVVLTEARFVENLEAALDSLDQPTFDGLNAYYISRAIRAAGFTVALSGTGGDELFGGYTSYRDLPVLHRWSRRAAWVPQKPADSRGEAGHLAVATLRRDGAASDPLGQTS